MSWYLQVLKKYAVFSGRARRKEYWMFVLFNIIFTVIAAIIDALIGSPYIIYALYCLAMIIPAIAVAARRLHDTDRSGWWILICLVPIVGAIILIIFLVLDSQPGENRFGANPKAPASQGQEA